MIYRIVSQFFRKRREQKFRKRAAAHRRQSQAPDDLLMSRLSSSNNPYYNSSNLGFQVLATQSYAKHDTADHAQGEAAWLRDDSNGEILAYEVAGTSFRTDAPPDPTANLKGLARLNKSPEKTWPSHNKTRSAIWSKDCFEKHHAPSRPLLKCPRLRYN